MPLVLSPRSLALAGLAACALGVSTTPARSDTTPQALPFFQAWTVASLITANDDWSNVPGIVAYKDDLAITTGLDPQTLVAPQSTLDVIANQANPNLLATGGIAEFAIADPTIAIQGSGTADAPYVQVTFDASPHAAVSVSYTLRDLDGSGDDAIQPVALQYRIGSSGDFTNIPEAFIPDATQGPNLSGGAIPVFVTLPPAVGHQPVVQIRIITTNAVGNDEWVGIDDITVGATTSPSGLGSSSPFFVAGGDAILLSTAVQPGTNPLSTALTVTCDLSSIGGPSSQALHDDGTNGDDAPGDYTYRLQTTVPFAAPVGPAELPVTLEDAQGRSGLTTIQFQVTESGLDVPGSGASALFVRPPFPNPMRGATSLTYSLSEPTDVHVAVHDAGGRRIAVLEDRAMVPAGPHVLVWTGRDENGRRVAPGTYVCRIIAGNLRASQRVIVVR